MPPANQNRFSPLIILFIFSLLIFEIIAWDWWRHGPSAQLDLLVLRHTGKLMALHPGLSEFINLAGILGKSWFLWTLALCGGIFLARQKDWPALGLFLIIVILGSWLVDPLQNWFQRPRPLPDLPGARGFSFPSGSAYFAAVVYGALIFLLARHTPKRWAQGALLLAALAAVLLVGLSGLGLRLHWLTDVLGAYALASSWLLLNFLGYRKMRQRMRS